jgi:hypothetical protein
MHTIYYCFGGFAEAHHTGFAIRLTENCSRVGRNPTLCTFFLPSLLLAEVEPFVAGEEWSAGLESSTVLLGVSCLLVRKRVP